MSDDPVLSAFDETGAYLRGHFRLTSGLHSPEYLQCALVLQHPRHAERFGQMLASEFRRGHAVSHIDMVAAPAIGGLIIGHEVARALGARFIFAERDAAGGMTLRRGFTVSPGETAVVVEDVVTTGGSTREVVKLLQKAGANVIAAGSIIDRSAGAADAGVPYIALKTMQVLAYPAQECPLCREGLPVEKPGSRPTAAPAYRSVRRIRITVAYDGTDYHGWQVQPGLATIQGTLEDAVSEIEGRTVQVAGSGRTDAGVHALAQTAAFSLENPIPAANLMKALNRLLPRDIRVLTVAETASNFHPRFDAIAKTYEYRVWRGEVCSPFERRYVHHHPYPLDLGTMGAAAEMFTGEHDFTAFAAADDKDAHGGSKVRRIFCSEVATDGERLTYTVRGSGFLKHMVRNIVGVLFEVGKGNLAPEEVAARLQPGCAIAAGPALPARGLFLVGVEYKNEPAAGPATPSAAAL